MIDTITYDVVEHVPPAQRPLTRLTGFCNHGIVYAVKRDKNWHKLTNPSNVSLTPHIRHALAVRLLNNTKVEGILQEDIDNYARLIALKVGDPRDSRMRTQPVDPLVDGLWSLTVDEALTDHILDPNPAIEIVKREVAINHDVTGKSVMNIIFTERIEQAMMDRRKRQKLNGKAKVSNKATS